MSRYQKGKNSGVFGGIRRIPTSGVFWQRILTSAIKNKHGTFRPFATPVCVYPPPFLAIHHWVKPIWILLKQETVSGSGISWAICKSAPRSEQITTPTPHHSEFFYRPDALPAAQPTASKHWRDSCLLGTQQQTHHMPLMLSTDKKDRRTDWTKLDCFVNPALHVIVVWIEHLCRPAVSRIKLHNNAFFNIARIRRWLSTLPVYMGR